MPGSATLKGHSISFIDGIGKLHGGGGVTTSFVKTNKLMDWQEPSMITMGLFLGGHHILKEWQPFPNKSFDTT